MDSMYERWEADAKAFREYAEKSLNEHEGTYRALYEYEKIETCVNEFTTTIGAKTVFDIDRDEDAEERMWLVEYGVDDTFTKTDEELLNKLAKSYLDDNGITNYTFVQSEFYSEVIRRVNDPNVRHYSAREILADWEDD